MALREYRRKRSFDRTAEPRGKPARKARGNAYVIQKHDASRLHYDLRLQIGGVMKSWAVPKGPSLDPHERRLAVEVEDHPLEYNKFEGTIPEGEYGGGTVMVWDRGTWEAHGDTARDWKAGKLKFALHGEKLSGDWMLVRMRARREKHDDGKQWLLIKERDAAARPGSGSAIVDEQDTSVVTGRDLAAIAAGKRAPRRAAAAGRKAAAAGNGAPAKASARTRRAPAASGGDPLPATLAPELATLVDHPPEGDEWLHETKFDGYRILCRIDGGRVRLTSRNDKDWTGRLSVLVAALQKLPVRRAWIDGELVALESNGTTSFQALQNAMKDGRMDELVYFAFDLLHLDGRDLRGEPLEARKAALAKLLGRAKTIAALVRYSDHVTGRGRAFFDQACRVGLEGVVSKRRDAPYRGSRGKDWLKTKCIQRQEFVIGGWTEPRGGREAFGALLLGVHDSDGALDYSGRVGTGFDADTLRDVIKKLKPLKRSSAPFAHPPTGPEARGVHWAKPALVAEITFSNWTRDGRLRHPSFQGLREDKRADDVVREEAAPMATKGTRGGRKAAARATTRAGAHPVAPHARAAAARSASREPAVATARRGRSGRMVAGAPAEVAGVRLTHPERVIDAESGLTKLDLARYVERIAPRMLPYVAGRPLSVVRCPEGVAGEHFFQKHAGRGMPQQVRGVDVEESSGTARYLAVEDAGGLVALVQMGVIEFHPWGARADDVERPDLMVFDLDPDPAVKWSAVVAAATELRRRLRTAGLEAFAKTTGGKGLHVVAPLTPRAGWDAVRAFSRTLAESFANEDPEHFTAQSLKSKRHGRIFIDYLRNGRGATAVAPWSPRARPGVPIAIPVPWTALKPGARGGPPEVGDALRGAGRADPWRDYERARRPLPGTSAGARSRGTAARASQAR